MLEREKSRDGSERSTPSNVCTSGNGGSERGMVSPQATQQVGGSSPDSQTCAFLSPGFVSRGMWVIVGDGKGGLGGTRLATSHHHVLNHSSGDPGISETRFIEPLQKLARRPGHRASSCNFQQRGGQHVGAATRGFYSKHVGKESTSGSH